MYVGIIICIQPLRLLLYIRNDNAIVLPQTLLSLLSVSTRDLLHSAITAQIVRRCYLFSLSLSLSYNFLNNIKLFLLSLFLNEMTIDGITIAVGVVTAVVAIPWP